uniref:Uncharacterized protein n=1 Tax=Anguilla anguilla TaxID=7936 RepID=A0A0E9Q8M5_ANGAN
MGLTMFSFNKADLDMNFDQFFEPNIICHIVQLFLSNCSNL